MLAENFATMNAPTNGSTSVPDWALNMEKFYNDNYMTWWAAMQHNGYAWEAVKVPTEDGYTLTAFHITGKIAEDGSTVTREPTEAPVIVQHGLGSDAATWLWSYRTGVPLPL